MHADRTDCMHHRRPLGLLFISFVFFFSSIPPVSLPLPIYLSITTTASFPTLPLSFYFIFFIEVYFFNRKFANRKACNPSGTKYGMEVNFVLFQIIMTVRMLLALCFLRSYCIIDRTRWSAQMRMRSCALCACVNVARKVQ